MGVYQKGGVSQAAQGLFLSPQACSKILQKLETELDASLFKRTHYGMEPTAQGDALYRQAQALADLLGEVKRDINAIGRRPSVLNVASTQGIKEYLSLAYAKEFSLAHPFITLNIMESTDVVARERMRNNAVELGILGGPIDLTVFRGIPFYPAPDLLGRKSTASAGAERPGGFRGSRRSALGLDKRGIRLVPSDSQSAFERKGAPGYRGRGDGIELLSSSCR
jgi:DNA-binding transcriptional LysR family regulator